MPSDTPRSSQIVDVFFIIRDFKTQTLIIVLKLSIGHGLGDLSCFPYEGQEVRVRIGFCQQFDIIMVINS